MPRIKIPCPHCGTEREIEDNSLAPAPPCLNCGTTVPPSGASNAEVQPPHPQPLSPEAGERGEGRPPAPLSPEAGERGACQSDYQTIFAAAPPAGARTLGEDGVPALWQTGDVLLDLYEVRGVLGEGGMGTVHKVHHRGWKLDLAVKSPRPDVLAVPGGAESFEREAQTWVHLGLHPYVVSCYYVRRLGGIPRVFAEFVEQGSLAEWIHGRQGQPSRLYAGAPDLALERMLDIAIQFAWGLHHAHDQGLIHQDVKPHNVMMTRTGIAKVTDFGLAKAGARVGPARPLRPGQSLLVSYGGMTPAYCSPEQANRHPLTRQTDIWSWAVSILEMFAGDVTWPAGQLAGEALEGFLESGSGDASIPQMPSALAELLRRCFQKNPEARPRDFLEIVAVLAEEFRRLTGRAYPRPAPKAGTTLADTLNNRAISLLDLGKTAEAENAWEQALAAESLHPEANYNLGVLRWRQGKVEDDHLVQQLSEVRASHPGQWLPLYLLARVHLERGDFAAAVTALSSLSSAEADPEEVRATLALAQEGLAKQGPLLNWSRIIEGDLRLVSLDPAGNKALCISTIREGQPALRSPGPRPPRLLLPSPLSRSRLNRLVLGQQDTSGPVVERLSQIVKLWDVTAERCLRTTRCPPTTHSSPWFLSIAGRYALTEDVPGRFRLWDMETGLCLSKFSNKTNAPPGAKEPDLPPLLRQVVKVCNLMSELGLASGTSSVSWSSDGRQALFCRNGLSLEWWDVDGRRCQRVLSGVTERVTAAALSGDGRHALSGGGDHELRLWESASGRCLRTFRGHLDEITAMTWTSDGRFALTGSKDKTLKLWEIAKGRCLRTLTGHTSTVMAVSVSADSRFALSGDLDHYLKRWALLSDAVRPLAPVVLSRIVASELALAYERLLEQARQAWSRGEVLETARQLREARAQPGCQRAPEALHEWTKLYPCLPHQAFRGGWQVRRLEGHTARVTCVSLSADGELVLSGSDDATLRLWETGTGRCVQVLQGHNTSVYAACLSADGRRALSGSGDTTARLWDAASGQLLRRFEKHRTWVSAVCLSAEGDWALSSSGETLRQWHADRARPVRRRGAGAEVATLSWSADRRLVVTGSGSSVKVWDLARGRCLCVLNGHTDKVNAVCFSQDGRHILSGGSDQTLRLWSVKGGCLRTFRGHAGAVMAVCLSTDGRYALSGGQDRTLKLWDAASGRCLRTFEGHGGPVTSVQFSRDGRLAVSGSADQTVAVWMLDWELEDRQPADWDEGARPYLDSFLTVHIPFIPENRLQRLLGRRSLVQCGQPVWTEEEFRDLVHLLGCAGLGWLRPQGVREELKRAAGNLPAPPPLSTMAPQEPAVQELPQSGLSIQGTNLCRQDEVGLVRETYPLADITQAVLRHQLDYAHLRKAAIPILVALIIWLVILAPGQPTRWESLAEVLSLEAGNYSVPWLKLISRFLWAVALIVAVVAGLFRLGAFAWTRKPWLCLTWKEGQARYPLRDPRRDCRRFVKTLQGLLQTPS